MPVGFEYNGQRYDNPDTMPVDVRRAYENLIEFLGENLHLPDREITPSSFPAQTCASASKKTDNPIAGHHPYALTPEGQGFSERYHKLFGESGDPDIADLYSFLNQPPAPAKGPAIIEAPQDPPARNPPSPKEFVHPHWWPRPHRNAQSVMSSRAVFSLLLVLLIFSLGVAAWSVFFGYY